MAITKGDLPFNSNSNMTYSLVEWLDRSLSSTALYNSSSICLNRLSIITIIFKRGMKCLSVKPVYFVKIFSLEPTISFLSDLKDPFALYETMRIENPVHWDEEKNVWEVYSYSGCKSILSSPFAYVHSIDPKKDQDLNNFASIMKSQFVRLSNGANHEIARYTASLLFNNIKDIEIKNIADQLMLNEPNASAIDWVDVICKKLPVIAVLKCFGFSNPDCDMIMRNVEQLVNIMLPNKTPEQAIRLNEAAKEIFQITEKHLLESGLYDPIINTLSKQFPNENVVSWCVSNLIGLSIIQGYDGNRGLLSNSMFQILKHANSMTPQIKNKSYLKKSVIETLRYDPPVHNTRRKASEDIFIDKQVIKKDEEILVVLAAANRDPKQFSNPNHFDIERKTNVEHLTFGFGRHACMASEFAANLAIETLAYFFERYNTIELIEEPILFERKVNVRIPKSIKISLS
jgi:cytochrome P450